MMVTGRIHSIESLGALDGPGLRAVIFFQGCPLRCRYCHNPDTWATDAGHALTVPALLERIERLRPYFRDHGGVTLSGGEPMLQADFALELLRALKDRGIHTAIDTSGAILNDAVRACLDVADLVILDIKHTDPDAYASLTGGRFDDVLRFLDHTRTPAAALWVRQVIVPGLNDTPAQIRALASLIGPQPRLTKAELLPYHDAARAKYDALGLAYPLPDTPPADASLLAALSAALRAALAPWRH